MTERLVFDERLLNKYAVEDLAGAQPRLHAALLAWFAAFGDFDDTSLDRLLHARGPDEVERWRVPAQAALGAIPELVQALDGVVVELEAALAGAEVSPERARLEALLQSARLNRTTLAERAPELVARALGATASYEDARATATAAVEHAARRLSQLREQSEDTSRSYGELQPLFAELQLVWQDLNRALAPLARADQRAVRGSQEDAMRAAATALCRNLFQCKMKDRARGVLPAPEITPPGDSAPEQLAAALARGDFVAAHATLAPFLANAWTAERLATELRQSARDVADASHLAEPPPAGGYQVSANPLDYVAVRALSNHVVPAEITAANYRGWFIIQIQTEAEDAGLTDIDYLANLYVVALGTPAGERIGYIAFGE
jgi:hypothetical protein